MPGEDAIWDPVTGDRQLAVASALTGHPGRAAELLGEVQVLREARPDPDDRDGLGVLVGRYLRTRSSGPRPPSDAADGSHHPDDLDLVLARIDGLSPLGRAALVLWQQQGLTLREVAALLDRSVSSTSRVLAEAQREVTADPAVVVAALATVPMASRSGVDAAAGRFGQTRRRRRRRGLLVLVAALALVIGGTVVPGALERRSSYVRPYGAWVHGFDFEATGGWRPGGRTLTAGRDSLTVYRGPDDRRSCLVDLTSSEAVWQAPQGERVRVQGRPAILVRPSAGGAPYLWWAIDPRVAAVIGCSDGSDLETLLSLAERVRLRAVPLRLPFAVGEVGDGVTTRFISTRDRVVLAMSLPPGQVSRSSATVYVSLPGSDRIPERPRRLGVNVLGRSGSLDRGRNGGLALCFPVQTSQACVTSYVFRESTDPQQTRLRTRLTAIAAGLRFAPQVDDSSTWFDAATMLPP